MQQDVEVLIVVICEQNPDSPPDPILIQFVRDAIEKIDGIRETYLAPATADIGALAKWDENEIPNFKELILKIDGVTEVKITILVPLD